jgi:hypothetical protein
VLGEAYGEHLAVTPTLADPPLDDGMPHYQGYGWTVTHVPSGLAVRRMCCIHDARDTARHLATAAGIDWTRPARDLGADPAVRDAVHRTRALFTVCDTEGWKAA